MDGGNRILWPLARSTIDCVYSYEGGGGAQISCKNKTTHNVRQVWWFHGIMVLRWCTRRGRYYQPTWPSQVGPSGSEQANTTQFLRSNKKKSLKSSLSTRRISCSLVFVYFHVIFFGISGPKITQMFKGFFCVAFLCCCCVCA